MLLVAGALGHRRFKKMEELAKLLSERCTVINYDRRGRGDSTEVKPYALEREFEDLRALIEAEGGSAALWGWSSGGALALRAAAAGVPVERISVYEVPFMIDPAGRLPVRDYGERLDRLVAADDRSGAVKHFMQGAMGMPGPMVALMMLMPMWKQLKANAHTLPYDWAALGTHTMYGGPLDPAEWATVTVPVQVVTGQKSPAELQKGSRALAEVLPNSELHELEGVSHNLKMKRLAPVLSEFLAAQPPAARATDQPEAA